jgi:uncharacterized membrane protein
MQVSTPARQPAELPWATSPWLRLYSLAALGFGGLLFYSQTRAFAWDEGFHLLAAQLIKGGKRPYLDFCFPQTPLNAYLNAGWMKLFGESWRPIHALSAFWVIAGALLTAGFVMKHLPVAQWKLAGGLAALAMVAMNSEVVLFGPIGQAYGLCLFLSVAAFRLAVCSVERRGPQWAGAAGVLAGAAAASSLLTAVVAPLLLLWIAIENRAGNRWLKAGAFGAGAALPFAPVLWLFLESPKPVLFNIIQYQALYRSTKWTGATGQDISVLTSWIDSAQGLALLLLSAAGIWFIVKHSGWDRARRSEFYLAGWLTLGLGAELGLAHPTFERYFLLVIPFAAILAMVGLYVAACRLGLGERPFVPTLFLIVLVALGLGKALYEDRDSYCWKDCEQIAEQVQKVTPPRGNVWADELFYFLMRQAPPDGMEFSYAHDLELPAAQAAEFHILPNSKIQDQVRAGLYNTVAACYESDDTGKLNMPQLFRRQTEIRDCNVYWDFTGKQ